MGPDKLIRKFQFGHVIYMKNSMLNLPKLLNEAMNEITQTAQILLIFYIR